jgi:hypothetical protein
VAPGAKRDSPFPLLQSKPVLPGERESQESGKDNAKREESIHAKEPAMAMRTRQAGVQGPKIEGLQRKPQKKSQPAALKNRCSWKETSLVSNDKIKGFFYGLSAGFLIGSFFKSADEVRNSPAGQPRDANANPIGPASGIIRLTGNLRGRREKAAGVGN